MAQHYWLCKSEPDAYSIDDLVKEGTATWDGIRNYQARNSLAKDMQPGDRVFFYQSSAKEIGIVGEMEVVGNAFPDPLQFVKTSGYYDEKSIATSPTWYARHLKFIARLPRVLTLAELRAVPALAKMRVLERGSRLSITPVTQGEYDTIQKMIKKLS